MSQNYKSYQFYEANDSDKDENNETTPSASKLVNKQNRKGMENQTREKFLGSNSDSKEKGNLSDDSDDDKAGDISQNRKKLKTEQEPNFKAELDNSAASTNPNTNQQQVDANKVMEIENQPSVLETSAAHDESDIPQTELSDNKPLAFIEAVKSKKAQVYVPNSFDPSTLMEIPKGKSYNEPTLSKKKSGKYTSSSPSPARENPASKNTPSAENRQKSRLSSQLSKIKESLKNLPAENPDSDDAERNTENIPLADKPKFFIDAAPLGVIEQEGEEKKINFQDRTLDSNERQYIVLGQERPFKTQEKNILEKLEKFLVPKEEEKKEEAAQEEEEEKGEVVEDEFNFESRYFMYNPTKVCNRCKRPGHYEKWCPEEITVKCSFCVGPHKTDNCIQIICFHCYGIGHRARDCDAPGSLLCYRCGKKGHKISTCGMIVMKDTTLDVEKEKQRADIKCIICGRYGHSKCARQNVTNRSNNKWFDGLYKEGAENRRESKKAELNMKVLARAKEVEAIEFEGAVSGDDDSYEGLEDFAKIEAPEYQSASSHKEKRYKDKKHHHHRDHHRDNHRDHHRDNHREYHRDNRYHHRDHHSNSKKQKRYYN